MQVKNKQIQKHRKKIIGLLLIIYSILHYLLFGFDLWVILFVILGSYWIFSALKKTKAELKKEDILL